MAESLKDKTAKGLLWGAVNNGTQQVLVLLFGIVLGRLLGPEEYGMVGMVTLFTLLGNALQESGFRAALVNLKTVRHADYNAVFWCSVGIGLAAYALLFAAAPAIARFYHEPRLVPLARYCFLAVPIASLGTAQGAYLCRHLKVKEQALSGLTAHVVSGLLGIGLACCGCSYWGIATQSLAYLVTVTACTWRFSPWRPTLTFDFAPLRPLFAFSSKLLVTNLVSQLNNHLLSVLLGRFFHAGAVGNYHQANKWNATGHQFVSGMIGSVAQPVLASVRDDRPRASRVFRRILRFTAFVSFPALFGLATVTRELILLTVGERWTGSIPLLRLLCLGGAFVPLSLLFANLIISQGRSALYMRNILAQLLLQLGAVLAIAALGGGIRQMVLAYAALQMGWLPVWLAFARRFVDLTAAGLCRDLLPFVAGAALACTAAGAAASLTGAGLLPSLGLKVAPAALCYTAWVRWWGGPLLDECLTYLLKKKTT